jgi:hypothetical protein
MPTIKQLSRIFSADDSLNRLQDQLAAAFNPILRNVQGDLTGPLESPSVVGLQGRLLSAVAPTTGQALVWTGTQWAPGTAGGTQFITSVLPPLTVVSGVLSLPQADATTDGYLSAADWVTFDSKVGSVTASSPLASSGGLTPNISLTGVVAAANGGTGLSSPGTVGNVLTSNGTGWTSSPVSASPSGAAGGVLGYTGSTYPNPNGLAASLFTVPGEGYIRLRYGADTLGNLVTTFFLMDSTGTTSTTVDRSVGIRAGAATGGQFGVNIAGGDLTLQAGTGSGVVSGGGGGVAYLLGGNGGIGAWDGGSAIVQGGIGSSGGGNGGTAELIGGFAASSATRGGNTYVRGGGAPGGVNGGDVFIIGGSNQFSNATGGDVTVRGGAGTTNGSVIIGDQNTAAIQIGAASSPPSLSLQGQPVDITTALPVTNQALTWDGSKWVPAYPSALPRYGNIAVVDAVNGNNSTGAINGTPFLTVEAGLAAITTAGTPATLWIMPGTYTLASATTGLTMPTGCTMRGHNTQTTRIVMNASNPGGTVTLLTMGESSRVEDLTLTLNSSNATTNLVGVNTPGTSSTTSKLRTAVVTVDNSGLAYTTTTNVYGIYDNGTGTLGPSSFSFNFTRGVTINVFSNGGGNKRAVYVTTTNDITFRDTNFYVKAPVSSLSAGSYVGVETTDANCSVQFRTCSISGATTSGSYTGSDILQTTPGTGFINNGIQLGPGVDLINKTAGGRPFTTYVTPTTIEYGLNANLVNSPHYLWPGVQTAADNTEIFYRFQQKSICQGMSVYLRTAPGVGKSVTVTVNRSTTSTPGSGVATSITATISGTALTADHYTSSVDFGQGEYLSVEIDGTSGNAAQDLVVELDLF